MTQVWKLVSVIITKTIHFIHQISNIHSVLFAYGNPKVSLQAVCESKEQNRGTERGRNADTEHHSATAREANSSWYSWFILMQLVSDWGQDGTGRHNYIKQKNKRSQQWSKCQGCRCTESGTGPTGSRGSCHRLSLIFHEKGTTTSKFEVMRHVSTFQRTLSVPWELKRGNCDTSFKSRVIPGPPFLL